MLPPVANYGFAPAVNVANNPIFHTSWNDTVIALVDIPLKNGNIRVTGGNATIRCGKSGKQAKGDIVKITRFIKRYYKLGGFLDGRKMSSQRLIRHINCQEFFRSVPKVASFLQLSFERAIFVTMFQAPILLFGSVETWSWVIYPCF